MSSASFYDQAALADGYIISAMYDTEAQTCYGSQADPIRLSMTLFA